MSDLGTMIRRHYEEAAPPVDIETLATRMEARPGRPRLRVHRGLAIALAVALMVIIAIGVPLLLGESSQPDVIQSSIPAPTTAASIPEPTTPVSTTLPPASTTSTMPTTTLPSTWTTFTESAGAPAGTVYQVLAASDGTAWAVGDGGIGHFDGTEWSPVSTPDGFVTDPMAEPVAMPHHRDPTVVIAEAPDGSLWFANMGGVHHLADGTWTAYPHPVEEMPPDWVPNPGEEPQSAVPVAIGVMGDGSVWIAAIDNLWTWRDETWVTAGEFLGGDEWMMGGVYEVVVAVDGALWVSGIGQPAGLYRYDGSTGTTVATYSWPGFYLAEIRAATTDGAWVVAGYGEPDRRLIYAGADEWLEYPLGDTTDVALAPDGTVWVTVTSEPIDPCLGYCGPVEPVTEPGIYRFDQTGWTHFTTGDGLASDNALSVSIGPDGSVWFGTGGGISRLLPDATDAGGRSVSW